MINDSTYLTIIDFFTNTPPKSDDDVHALASKLGLEAHDVEQAIYDILSAFLSGGKYNTKPGADIDTEQLAMGANVEMEHLDPKANPVIVKALAERISKDHLVELFKYYTYLKKMEDEGKKLELNDDAIIASVIKECRK